MSVFSQNIGVIVLKSMRRQKKKVKIKVERENVTYYVINIYILTCTQNIILRINIYNNCFNFNYNINTVMILLLHFLKEKVTIESIIIYFYLDINDFKIYSYQNVLTHKFTYTLCDILVLY